MNLVVSWYKRDVKKQRFQVRYWMVSNIFIFLYISREKFVENFLSVAKMASLDERENCFAANVNMICIC